MLTYQDVVTIKLGVLTTAATDWDDMADGFKDLETLYAAKVESVATDGIWHGVSQAAAAVQLGATRQQFADAQTEARAIASLLRDAYQQFAKLIGHVNDVVERVKADEMSVNSQGEAVYDFRKLTPMRHDEDYPKYVSKAKDAEAAWTKKIKEAVQAVDDADQGVKLALDEAAGVKSWFERALDPFGGQAHTFNGSAVGDIEVYEAREAKQYADRLLHGEKLTADERAEMDRDFRDNAHNKAFSQTFLDSLGPEDTLKLSNRFNDLAYNEDTTHKTQYLGLEQGLANTVSGATSVPDFRGPDGKRLTYGSKAYQEAFSAWKKTPDASFYNDWRDGLRKAGLEKYDLDAAADNTNTVAKGHGQQVRGYQSFVTLMEEGSDHPSSQFMADVTDDMITAEKHDKNVWDLYGNFDHTNGKSWFANDPVDGALGIMGRDPETSTGYLDPHSGGGSNDRLHYLLKERDWNVTNTTEWQGEREISAPDAADGDNRVGLGAAIEAGATGHPAGDTTQQSDGKHSAAEARIMQSTVNLLDQGTNGDSITANLRDPIARALVDYAPDTHNTLTHDPRYTYTEGGSVFQDANGGHLNVSQDSLTRVLRGVSDNPQNFAHLYDAERAQAAHTLAGADATYSNNKDWENRVADVGMGAGVFNAIGADVILDDRDARKAWADDVARYSYHAIGAPLTIIPGVGDTAQRMVDGATYEWSKDVKAEADQVANIGVAKAMGAKSQGALDLVQQWETTRGMDYTKDPVANYLQDYMNLHYGSARNQALADLHRGLS
ncbi:hypothetical protein SMIR_02910 [Streptomyces mirabilis]|uniref:hypothetical protein n=1 Tax=Streptomyces mirabilis TaxID=68239 RepID=UPI001BAF48F8|nr:hypothetical protein [Streptomyces mirabilis]QUW78222.1 hypothetical protein SMIR_02910 [Streptomyces mirabilis]